VTGRDGGGGRVVRQAEAARGGGGDDGALVVGGNDGVEPPRGREAGDLGGGTRRVAQVERDRVPGGDLLEGLARFRSDDRLDAEVGGRFQEILRLVGRGRQQEQDAPATPSLQTRSSIGM